MPNAKVSQKIPWHERHQNGMREAQRMSGLPEGAPAKSVARMLLDKGLVAETVDMLFGTSPEKARKNMNPAELKLYLALRMGQCRSLLQEIIEQHDWCSDRAMDDRHPIEVYPGEFLIIPEQVAAKFHQAAK
ncbi:MAG: hypothetical protein COY66_04110 [Candidatus Kerfeldbacteria bacterium CG_4_10_14_0_8_um_filter_42_10]|uniref:Uncharacterized protein n=1 Tax=Candidatus Kerfeldbacteria bacterium CG_4_10_14_0_8_um_filter_42_10 TaxID=2014248 RepID=A0A2M7RI65_9BACT|nr:MAG: hypothetical protein COY66_04110 [Candidatus Kerfeldbacteria bacterium CG_4_10_14_0_8_um_filter_42_10]